MSRETTASEPIEIKLAAIEARLDALIKAVCLMHDALNRSDRRYIAVYGERIMKSLRPLMDNVRDRGNV